MGTFQTAIEVGDLAASRFRPVDALVDTGASYTTVPKSLLRDLGVTPHAERVFLLANGQSITRPIGRTWVRVDGRQEMTIVVFADEGAMPLLGAVTLEEMASASTR